MGDANSCCRVLTGLVVARMPLLLRILVSGSVTPLMYGKTARPFWESDSSVHLKNIPTNSSGEGMTSDYLNDFRLLEIEANAVIYLRPKYSLKKLNSERLTVRLG